MEPPLINDSTFSSSNPSLSEIWPLPLPPLTNKRNLSLSEDNSNSKHIKLGIEGEEGSSDHDQNAAFKPQPDAPCNLQQNANPSSAESPPPPQPKADFIHVRARRGQATDSHSLAERARREKISERMKILQDIVPGCNKVIGKALVLDEIINYIQSLHRQVEFLSMKIEAVNSRLNMQPAIECFPSKDSFDLSGIIFGPQASRGYAQGSQPGWLHMQIADSFDKTT